MGLRSKSYCVQMTPIPWTRPKLNGQRFFDGQVKQKVCFGLYLQQQQENEPVFREKPVHIDMVFYMRIPFSKRKQRIPHYHNSVPDLDNLVKFVLDAIKDIIIFDDRIIGKISAKKIYDIDPRTEFTITEMD